MFIQFYFEFEPFFYIVLLNKPSANIDDGFKLKERTEVENCALKIAYKWNFIMLYMLLYNQVLKNSYMFQIQSSYNSIKHSKSNSNSLYYDVSSRKIRI